MKTLNHFQNNQINNIFASKVLGGEPGDTSTATATNPTNVDAKEIDGNTVTITATAFHVTLGSATYSFSNCKNVNGALTCTATAH